MNQTFFYKTLLMINFFKK